MALFTDKFNHSLSQNFIRKIIQSRGCSAPPPPNSFTLKKKKQLFGPCPRQAPGSRFGLVPDCSAVCSPYLLLEGTWNSAGHLLSWEEPCSDLMCLLNPSLLHRLWSHSSKPVAEVSLHRCQEVWLALCRVQRALTGGTPVPGSWCGSVRSSGDVFSHLSVSSPRAQMLIAVLLMCLKEKITF